MTDLAPLEAAALAPGIRSRFVPDINGLRVHMLEAGSSAERRPLILLLHGFPEFAFSWRKVVLPLAAAGFDIPPDIGRCDGGWCRGHRLSQRNGASAEGHAADSDNHPAA